MSLAAPLTDTSPDAARVWIDCYRRMSPAEKWRILNDLFKTAKSLHAAGVRRRIPGATEEVVRGEWLRAILAPQEFAQVSGAWHDAVG